MRNVTPWVNEPSPDVSEFDAYVQSRGWELIQEWLDPYYDEEYDEEYPGHWTWFIMREERLPDDRLYAYNMSLGSHDIAGWPERWQFLVDFANLGYERDREKHLTGEE